MNYLFTFCGSDLVKTLQFLSAFLAQRSDETLLALYNLGKLHFVIMFVFKGKFHSNRLSYAHQSHLLFVNVDRSFLTQRDLLVGGRVQTLGLVQVETYIQLIIRQQLHSGKVN